MVFHFLITLLSLSATLVHHTHAFAFDFEECTSENNYLENKLKSDQLDKSCMQDPVGDSKSQINALVNGISDTVLASELKCISSGMQQFSVAGSGYKYVDCANENAPPSRKKRPCISENYVRYIYTQLKKVSNCVGTPINELSKLYARESGFHLNVVSGTGCRGIGQLSRIAVDDIDRIDQIEAAKSSKFSASYTPKTYSTEALKLEATCSDFTVELNRKKSHEHSLPQCEVTALPQNPTRNLLYSARIYKFLNDGVVENRLMKYPDVVQRLNLFEFSVEDLNTIKTRLARTMYNGGYPSVSASFRTFIKTKSALNPKPVDLNEFWSRYQNFILGLSSSSSQMKRDAVCKSNPRHACEVANYAVNVDRAAERVRKTGGATCFTK